MSPLTEICGSLQASQLVRDLILLTHPSAPASDLPDLTRPGNLSSSEASPHGVSGVTSQHLPEPPSEEPLFWEHNPGSIASYKQRGVDHLASAEHAESGVMEVLTARGGYTGSEDHARDQLQHSETQSDAGGRWRA